MKISIITINYNNAKGLEKTIQSVIDQTYSDVEYIVIDGNSTDGSREVIEKYSEKISYWVSEPDSGIYNAMNKGISQAHGDYLLFLNSGDSLLDKEVIYNIFEDKKYKTLLVRGNIILDQEIPKKSINKGDQEITLRDLMDGSILHQATFMHYTAFQKYGLYDENYKIVSDWKLFTEMIFHGEKSEYIDVDVALFDMHGISNNKKHAELMAREREAVLTTLIPATILSDYKRFIQVEHDANMSQQHYLANFILHNKFPRFCVRVLNKIYKIFNLL